jgi:hypothetical protein
VGNRIVKKFSMRDMREVIGDLSQTNYYMVSFSTLNNTLMSYIQKRIGFQEDVRLFLSRKSGLLCSEASLPTSSLATGEVRDNFMGIPQEFAHTRLYTDIDFTFYVDTNYVNLRVFESWIDYISGGSEGDQVSELNENYYRRMRYPDTYKVQTMFISKFEKDFNSQIDYQFINAFPKLITAIPVAYGAADLLKVTVQFSYDRYIVNPKGSIKKANISEFSDIPRVANDSVLSPELLDSIINYDGDTSFNGGSINDFIAGVNNGGITDLNFESDYKINLQRKPASQAQQTTESPAAATEQAAQPTPAAEPKGNELIDSDLPQTREEVEEILNDW